MNASQCLQKLHTLFSAQITHLFGNKFCDYSEWSGWQIFGKISCNDTVSDIIEHVLPGINIH